VRAVVLGEPFRWWGRGTLESDERLAGARVRLLRFGEAIRPDEGDIVLRPKAGWVLVLVPTEIGILVLLPRIAGDVGGFWDWLAVVGLVYFAGLAVRNRIVLRGPVLHRRGVALWSVPIHASGIEEVVLHYEWIPNVEPFPYRQLKIIQRGDRPTQTYSLRWWKNWGRIVRWLATYCTAPPRTATSSGR